MNTYNICRKFWDLGIVEITVLDHIYEFGEFHGSYSDLGRKIGKDVSATRKAVLKLESIGVLYVEKEMINKMERMISCTFNPEWEHNLTYNS